VIVFDLDGTLIDSARDLADSTNEMLTSLGAAPLPLERVTRLVGEGARRLVVGALEAADLQADVDDALRRFREIYDRRLFVHTRPYDGVPEMVRELAGRMRVGVLTNKPEAPSRRLLEGFELAPYVASVIGGDSGFPRKPDPAGLSHLISANGGDPAAAVFVGDSMIDVETARRAGIRMCVALYGFGRMRGDLKLRGDELLAQQPADVVRLVLGGLTEPPH